MPNLFAYGMIVLWPFIAILLYKKFDTVTATFWTIVGGFMLLPVKTAIDLPMIPAVGKDEISAIAALIGCVVIKNKKIRFFGANNLQKTLIGLLLFIPILNIFFNSEPMFNGQLWIQGLTLYDAISQVLAQYLELLPFVIAISIVKNIDDLEKIVRLLVVAGLVYSIPILFEIRISPQLHTWVYGFFPHSFAQQVRFGGFRAVVFMGHGLLVSTFIFVCVCAAAIQVKISTQQEKTRNVFIFGYLLLVLIASKSVGAVVLGALLSLSILFLFTSMQKIIVKIIVAVFLLYPTLSILNLVPYESIVEFISDFSVEKADSLDFRFTHEKELIDHAYEKFLIGWGSWGRNLLKGSIPDGYWVIIYGTYGAVYFYAFFGLFILPALSKLKGTKITLNERTVYVGFSLLLAGIIFDQIPNSSLGGSWLWFLSGCLSGYLFNIQGQNVRKYVVQ
jgi:hypothetical protein